MFACALVIVNAWVLVWFEQTLSSVALVWGVWGVATTVTLAVLLLGQALPMV